VGQGEKLILLVWQTGHDERKEQKSIVAEKEGTGDESRKKQKKKGGLS